MGTLRRRLVFGSLDSLLVEEDRVLVENYKLKPYIEGNLGNQGTEDCAYVPNYRHMQLFFQYQLLPLR